MGLGSAIITATIRVEDLEGAKSFYKNKLGLKEVAANPEGGDVIFEAGEGTRIYIYEGPKSVAEHTVAGFKVDNVLETVKELKEKGVKFESYDMPGIKTDEDNIATWGEYKSAWFKDPEGHILAIANM